MQSIANWLESHNRFRPHALALVDVDHDRRWTYAELHHEARCWAGTLQRLGVMQGDRVAVLAHNRGETLALAFAVAELGATLFPVNWRLAPAEIAWQLGDADARVVLHDATHAEVARQASPPGARTVPLDDGPGEEPGDGPGARLDAPWMLMYTSGSTGRPKGALLTHRQLHWNAFNTQLACDLTPDDVTLTFTPLFHTGGMNCLSMPLLWRGATVVLTKGVDPGQALRLIAEEQVSLLMGVPTIFQMLADHPDFEGADLSSVRDALCGGAALQAPLLETYLDRGIPLRQGFGMTEVGPNCFSMPHDRVRDKLGSVGLPIPHVAMRIVRPDGTECADDEPGELLLSGPAVFGGYLNRPDANASSFDGDWFKTGDVLARDAEGFYWVAGRLKEMFISGGENVYPAEVEAAIAEHPGVAHVAVVGVPHARWGEVGHAFVEPHDEDPSVTPDALRAALDGRLARFKIPKRFTIRAELPRTASGKIDKPALKAAALEAKETP